MPKKKAALTSVDKYRIVKPLIDQIVARIIETGTEEFEFHCLNLQKIIEVVEEKRNFSEK